MTRLRSVHSHLLACVDGCGRTLIDGQAVSWEPGQVLRGPVGAHHAFEISGNKPWTLAWIFFEDSEASPVMRSGKAELVEADTRDFVASIRMLLREASGPADRGTMAALVNLLDTHARRLCGTSPVDTRLWRLWEKVESDLARPWTTEQMAKVAHLSEEHLRRLCHKHYQRSPIKHLTYLRLSRASTLLRSLPDNIESIAQQVGYASVYSFSAAFKRWAGASPGSLRNRAAGTN